MNGIEKIISRMEADAKAERDAVTAAAQQKAESIRHDYQATADTLQQEAQVRRQAQNAERLEHLNGSSQMACRQRVLAVVEQAASVCYDSQPTETYRIAKTCKASGHTSVLEHISFTFHITGVSRTLLAQLTRHRHASFSVRSQRYCNEEDFQYVQPKTTYGDGYSLFRETMSEISSTYSALIFVHGVSVFYIFYLRLLI